VRCLHIELPEQVAKDFDIKAKQILALLEQTPTYDPETRVVVPREPTGYLSVHRNGMVYFAKKQFEVYTDTALQILPVYSEEALLEVEEKDDA